MDKMVTSGPGPESGDVACAELWISCIEGPEIPDRPGRFIYRNAGNIVATLDLSCLAAMDIAIRMFGVRKIVVCGHIECRCIEAASISGIAGQWLTPIKRIDSRVSFSGKAENDSLKRQRSEENVIEQLRSAAVTSIVKGAAAAGTPIDLVGLLFDPGSQEYLTIIEA